MATIVKNVKKLQTRLEWVCFVSIKVIWCQNRKNDFGGSSELKATPGVKTTSPAGAKRCMSVLSNLFLCGLNSLPTSFVLVL
jgi:hypothetical protein